MHFERFLTVIKLSPIITLFYIGVCKISYARCSGAISAHPVLFIEVVRRRSIMSDHHPLLELGKYITIPFQFQGVSRPNAVLR